MTAFPGFIDLQSGVDKTEAVAQWLEEGAWQLIFRPIGFGKTAWLDLLQAYCDEAAAPYSEERFSGTWIAAHPTVHKNARRVLRLSFVACTGRGDVALDPPFLRWIPDVFGRRESSAAMD